MLSVKEFVHDVKRRFSQKRRRDSCSTCAMDNFDRASSSSSGDSYSHYEQKRDSTSSSSTTSSLSSIPSLPASPERSRFASFIRSRSISTSSSKKSAPNVLHKARKIESRRYRLFSSSSRSKIRSSLDESAGSDEHRIAPRELPGVIDIRARSEKGVSETGSAQSSSQSSSFGDSLLQPESTQSSQTATLISTTSGFEELHSESDLHPDTAEFVRSMDFSSTCDAMSLHPSPRPDSAVLPVSAPAPAPAPPLAAPVYLPRLTVPSMFLPIPNVRSVSHPLLWWLAPRCSTRSTASTHDYRVDPSSPQTDPLGTHLTKYVPPDQRPRRDVVGEYAGRDLHEMVMSNSWRALAKMARDRIVASDPEDLSRILDLWSLRLSSLARLRLTNQASAECTNLFAVLNAVPPPSVLSSFPGSSFMPPSTPLHSSPAASPLSLTGLAQLPGTPSQKPSPLPPAAPSHHGINDLVHPFELTVFHARVHYWSGDSLGYVDALSRILGQCKERARQEARMVTQRKKITIRAREGGNLQDTCPSDSDQANEDDEAAAEEGTQNTATQDEEEEPDDVLAAAEANLSMWLERVARVCLILASQMIEMNDYQAAINLLVPFCTHRVPPALVSTPSPALHSALARIYLLCGNLEKAEKHFSIAASAVDSGTNGADYIAMNTALSAAASGNWTRAEEALGELVANDAGNFTAINNLAVVLLYQGKIKEGIHLLEGALKTSPSSVVVAEPFLFNLSTLYELRSAAAIDKKRALLVEVAKWSGDGLRTSCLKMPSS